MIKAPFLSAPLQSLGMDSLPTEICHCILEFSSLESVKVLRLTSKAWAVLGQEYLISPDFLCQTYRDDFTRLLAVANHSAFSPLIKSIRFDQGELHDYHARHNMYGHLSCRFRRPFQNFL